MKHTLMNVLIRGGRVIDPASGRDDHADIAIVQGQCVAVGSVPTDFAADHTIDATGLIVMPGLVDLSVRLREPGDEYKATLASELQAAVAGGVTTLVCPPDTDPVLDEPGLVEMLKHRARLLHLSHVYPLGALTQGLKGKHLTDMAQLSEAGCVGFSQADCPVSDTQVLLRALEYASTFDYTVWLRAQDSFLGQGGVAHAGSYASRLGLAGVPVMAETIALMTLFELIRATGAKVHICRVSSARGLELIRQAKSQGLKVTCDVSAHHVHLTDKDIGFFDANARVVPPFRDQQDRDTIVRALQEGIIDAICSDHSPVDDNAKSLPFAEAEPGVTGLELLLSLVLKWALQTGTPLVRALALVTCGPSRIIGSNLAGPVMGQAADLCIFDANASWRVSEANLVSQGKHTPYLGYDLQGRVLYTWVGGQLVYKASDITGD